MKVKYADISSDSPGRDNPDTTFSLFSRLDCFRISEPTLSSLCQTSCEQTEVPRIRHRKKFSSTFVCGRLNFTKESPACGRLRTYTLLW